MEHRNEQSKLEQFKIHFDAKMEEIFEQALKDTCYLMTSEAQKFVHTYPDQDIQLMRLADNLVVEFLDECEHKLLK